MPRILVADHNPTNRRIAELSFADEDLQVVSFGDGDGAAEFLRNNSVDVVLADVSLPSVDGYELCRRVRASGTSSHAPVILLVGRFEPFDHARAEEAGFHSWLTKPVEPSSLVDMVRRLLQEGRRARQHADLTSPARDGRSKSRVWTRSAAMLFEIPLAEGSQQVIFPLRVHQCRPHLPELGREAVLPPSFDRNAGGKTGHESAEATVSNLPLEAASDSPHLFESEESEDFEEDVWKEASAFDDKRFSEQVEEEQVSQPSPPAGGADEAVVDRVVTRLSERLPDLIRTILSEERSEES